MDWEPDFRDIFGEGPPPRRHKLQGGTIQRASLPQDFLDLELQQPNRQPNFGGVYRNHADNDTSPPPEINVPAPRRPPIISQTQDYQDEEMLDVGGAQDG